MLFKKLLDQPEAYRPFHHVEYHQKGRILAIGDIHGCPKTFSQLLAQLALQKDDQLFFLGDLVNKGPDSIGVVTKVLDLIFEGYSVYPLRGNHESMVIEDLDANDELIFYPDGIPVSTDDMKYSSALYKRFFRQLPYYYRIEDYVMVHAGLDLSLQDPFSDYESMMWLWDFEPKEPLGFTVIHGHTNTYLPLIKSSIVNNAQAINLDNGCYKKGSWEQGNLLAYELGAKKLFIQPNEE